MVCEQGSWISITVIQRLKISFFLYNIFIPVTINPFFYISDKLLHVASADASITAPITYYSQSMKKHIIRHQKIIPPHKLDTLDIKFNETASNVFLFCETKSACTSKLFILRNYLSLYQI